MRTFYGFAIGLVIGLLLTVVLELLRRWIMGPGGRKNPKDATD